VTPEHVYDIRLAVTLSEQTGIGGSLFINAQALNIQLLPDKMVELVTRAQNMLDQLVQEYR
jgi:hypothetical protein